MSVAVGRFDGFDRSLCEVVTDPEPGVSEVVECGLDLDYTRTGGLDYMKTGAKLALQGGDTRRTARYTTAGVVSYTKPIA
ncbi:hypothetical protein GCM10025298_05560 [Natronobiforma cellulositropha]